MEAQSARLIQLVRRASWLAALLAVLGVLLYLCQAVRFAHTTASSLDEGAYLYKGYLFASGQYHPFELYGPQTNKAPLAFLIPGFSERIFGPGLRTGRYLAVLFGGLALALTWLASLRMAGKWWAAAAVWVLALNPALIKIYSEGVTQSEIAFLLALTLVLCLGADRPPWQLALSGLVAGAMVMVRQNMVIVLPLLVLYIWWQHGARAALYAAGAGAAVLAFFHLLYWPYIMQLWTPWMPGAFRALLGPAAISLSGVSRWDPSIDAAGRVLSFFQGVRFHFVAVVGFAFGLILWPKRRDFSGAEFRQAVFLAALFVALLLMHSWAAISNDYCVFCFTPYLAFFSISAILFLVSVIRLLQRTAHPWRQALLAASALLLFAGTGYSAFEDLGDGLLLLNVPRLRAGRILPGVTTLWDLIANKFAINRNLAEKLVSSAAGLLVGVAILLLAFLLFRRLRGRGVNYGYVLCILVLGLGMLCAPLLAGSAGQPDCPGMDVVRANEEAGAYLAAHIPDGSTVYWNGGLSVAPLLYAPGLRIYLPQINDGYAFRVGGNADELLKYGFWNDTLSRQWLREADFVVVEGWRYAGMKASLPASVYDEFPRSPAGTSCLDGSGLRIFRRK
jgi:4-amino-4-deoxy-L-arabinose transferase-like glycosyltransferase